MPQAHIPKRVTQHGMYVPNEDVLPVTLKPGQRDTIGSNIYDEEKKKNAHTYIAQDRVARETLYTGSHGGNTAPQDYAPPKSYKPVEHDWTEAGSGTGHWQSEYTATAQRGPAPTPASPRKQALDPAMNGKGFSSHFSSYTHEYGRYGSNPRDRIKQGATSLPITKTELLVGTTTGTNFVPGYQGFIPAHPSTDSARRAAAGLLDRSDTKNDYADTYHANKIGYTGHCPKSFRNDRGGRQPTCLTVAGRDYVTPRTFKPAVSA